MRAVLLPCACSLALATVSCGEADTSGNPLPEGVGRMDYPAETANAEPTNSAVDGPDGARGSRETGADLAVNLPAGFSVYPGAKVVSSTVIRQGDLPGNMITMQSADEPAKIAAFYRKQAEDAGMEIEFETDLGASKMVSAKRVEDGSAMDASAKREEGQSITTAQLILTGKKGG